MHDGELWQVFSQNGQPIAGKGAIDDEFDEDSSLVVGNAHVWLWRKVGAGLEILLQKRALTKKRKPGYCHISAGGHIDLGETAVEAAVRETREELGVMINPALLWLVQVTRMPGNQHDLGHVYTYELAGNETFSFDDGEVDSVQWLSLSKFEMMTKNPSAHMLIDCGAPYFETLIAAIKQNA